MNEKAIAQKYIDELFKLAKDRLFLLNNVDVREVTCDETATNILRGQEKFEEDIKEIGEKYQSAYPDIDFTKYSKEAESKFLNLMR